MSDATANREQIEKLEKQYWSTIEELQRLRRELPPEPVEDYTLKTLSGEARLARQLLAVSSPLARDPSRAADVPTTPRQER